MIENRVNGNLNLSRSIGDLQYKKDQNRDQKNQMISCFPDVVQKKLDKNTQFIFMACDGVWDVMQN